MGKSLLQSGPAVYAVKDPWHQYLSQQILLAANVANHRLFQRRQELLWPQKTALDISGTKFGQLAMMPNAQCQADPAELPLPRYAIQCVSVCR